MGLARAHYDVHGMRMTVEAQSQSLLDVIDTLLGAYAGVNGCSDGFLVSLGLRANTDGNRPGTA